MVIAMKKRRIIGYSILGICLVLAIVVTGVLGKYITSKQGTSYIESKDFIYECNLENGKTYYINPSNTPTSINCIVVNYIGSKISEDDITGTVKLSKDSILVGEVYDFTMNKNVETKLDVNMAVSSLTPGDKYTMEIKTQTPYIKTITANFIVSDYSSVSTYSIDDKGAWVEVEIKIGAVIPASGITINYEGLAPDNTNELMADWLSSDLEKTISSSKIETNSVITLIFIKESLVDYNEVSEVVLTDIIKIVNK